MHYGLLALVTPHDDEPVEWAVGAALAPYGQHLDTEPREEQCWCVASDLPVDAFIAAAGAAIRFDERIDAAQTALAPFVDEPELAAGVRAGLANEYGVLVLERQRAAELLWEHAAADPECEMCDGNGRRTTTCNVDGHWDWWVVGGGARGALADVELDELADAVPPYDTGTVVRAGDVDAGVALAPRFSALVTPDGAWHRPQRAPEEDVDGPWLALWEATLRDALAATPDALAVVVDCHY